MFKVVTGSNCYWMWWHKGTMFKVAFWFVNVVLPPTYMGRKNVRKKIRDAVKSGNILKRRISPRIIYKYTVSTVSYASLKKSKSKTETWDIHLETVESEEDTCIKIKASCKTPVAFLFNSSLINPDAIRTLEMSLKLYKKDVDEITYHYLVESLPVLQKRGKKNENKKRGITLHLILLVGNVISLFIAISEAVRQAFPKYAQLQKILRDELQDTGLDLAVPGGLFGGVIINFKVASEIQRMPTISRRVGALFWPLVNGLVGI
ncbi:hypothetical protein BC829DRAFT_424246 [Chytridium lagenaria]|nr:hypothetical protein BC829DRAFT_424246 [Chytridium lagenaria]